MTEMERATARFVRLQQAQLALQQALPGVVGMPAAYAAVRAALRIVSRQAGKAMARVKELEAETGDGRTP